MVGWGDRYEGCSGGKKVVGASARDSIVGGAYLWDVALRIRVWYRGAGHLVLDASEETERGVEQVRCGQQAVHGRGLAVGAVEVVGYGVSGTRAIGEAWA